MTTESDETMEVSSIGERMGELPRILGEHLGVRLSARAFAIGVGISSQSLNGYAKQGKMPPASAVADITRQHPYVNLRWLLLGEGEPIDRSGGDLAAAVLRMGAERGVTFERLNIEPAPGGGVRFEAAGVMSAT